MKIDFPSICIPFKTKYSHNQALIPLFSVKNLVASSKNQLAISEVKLFPFR